MADDFVAFFQAREKALLGRIEQATGKTVLRDVAAVEPDEIEENELAEQLDPVTLIAEADDGEEAAR